MMRDQQHQVSCTDSCGRTLLDAETAGRSGWHSLQITGRWRCPPCARELATANAPVITTGYCQLTESTNA